MSIKEIIAIAAAVLGGSTFLWIKLKINRYKKDAQYAREEAEEARAQSEQLAFEKQQLMKEQSLREAAFEALKHQDPTINTEAKVQIEKIRCQNTPRKEETSAGVIPSEESEKITTAAGTSEYMKNRLNIRKILQKERYGEKE